MTKYGLSKEKQDKLLKKVAEYSDYLATTLIGHFYWVSQQLAPPAGIDCLNNDALTILPGKTFLIEIL